MKTESILIERFKSQFRILHEADLSRLRELYSERIVFKDPVHEIRGLVELEDYFSALCSDLSDCRYEYLKGTFSRQSCVELPANQSPTAERQRSDAGLD